MLTYFGGFAIVQSRIVVVGGFSFVQDVLHMIGSSKKIKSKTSVLIAGQFHLI